MPLELSDLIAKSHSNATAEAYRSYVPTDAHLKLLTDTGKDVLLHFPPMPAACAMMSACYAARVQMNADIPVFVVAGRLSIGTSCIFGSDATSEEWASAFNESNPSWDGHCWVVLGDIIADISIFRTAYAQNSSSLLRNHVREHFGAGRGLLIASTAECRKSGFLYEPQYILTEVQITALMNGARTLFESSPRG